MKHENCTILRTVERKHFADIGDTQPTKVETVTERCGTPLFAGDNKEAGVCRSCAKGWEGDTNQFFNAAEKAKALQAGRDFYGKRVCA